MGTQSTRRVGSRLARLHQRRHIIRSRVGPGARPSPGIELVPIRCRRCQLRIRADWRPEPDVPFVGRSTAGIRPTPRPIQPGGKNCRAGGNRQIGGGGVGWRPSTHGSNINFHHGVVGVTAVSAMASTALIAAALQQLVADHRHVALDVVGATVEIELRRGGERRHREHRRQQPKQDRAGTPPRGGRVRAQGQEAADLAENGCGHGVRRSSVTKGHSVSRAVRTAKSRASRTDRCVRRGHADHLGLRLPPPPQRFDSKHNLATLLMIIIDLDVIHDTDQGDLPGIPSMANPD